MESIIKKYVVKKKHKELTKSHTSQYRPIHFVSMHNFCGSERLILFNASVMSTPIEKNIMSIYETY